MHLSHLLWSGSPFVHSGLWQELVRAGMSSGVEGPVTTSTQRHCTVFGGVEGNPLLFHPPYFVKMSLCAQHW